MENGWPVRRQGCVVLFWWPCRAVRSVSCSALPPGGADEWLWPYYVTCHTADRWFSSAPSKPSALSGRTQQSNGGHNPHVLFPGHTVLLPGHTVLFPGHTVLLPGHTVLFPGHTVLFSGADLITRPTSARGQVHNEAGIITRLTS